LEKKKTEQNGFFGPTPKKKRVVTFPADATMSGIFQLASTLNISLDSAPNFIPSGPLVVCCFEPFFWACWVGPRLLVYEPPRPRSRISKRQTRNLRLDEVTTFFFFVFLLASSTFFAGRSCRGPKFAHNGRHK
jgi:hypothetical protein